MAKIIFAMALALSVNTFAAEFKQVVVVTGTGGRSFAADTEVKTMKDACALANSTAEDQAVEACSAIDGKNLGFAKKTVSPVTTIGGRSGSCRITVEANCETTF